VLAAFTYTSGLRVPALIAVAKDALIFATTFAAIVVIPGKLGGYSAILTTVPQHKLLRARIPSERIAPMQRSRSDRHWRCSSVPTPCLIALLGYTAIAAGVGKDPAYASGFAQYGANFAVPALFLSSFPSWFVGVAFAAIAIGALVPAAVMSIACANLFTRNLYNEFIRPDCTEAEEARMAKIMSLVAKIGAVFILVIPQGYAIEFQLLGGIWTSSCCRRLCLAYTRVTSIRSRCRPAGSQARCQAPIWPRPKASPLRGAASAAR
jgi:solute:Na+ symporter, SSS family